MRVGHLRWQRYPVLDQFGAMPHEDTTRPGRLLFEPQGPMFDPSGDVGFAGIAPESRGLECQIRNFRPAACADDRQCHPDHHLASATAEVVACVRLAPMSIWQAQLQFALCDVGEVEGAVQNS